MIYRRDFIRELSFTAVGILVTLLAVLVSTQAINLLSRVVGKYVAIDAVLALVGFWVIGVTLLLLVLTAFISMLTILARYWRDNEMSVQLSCGLALEQWTRPVMQFAIPFIILITVIQLWMTPWTKLRSREYAEILRRKQELPLMEAGEFDNLGKRSDGVYFVETFDTESNIMKSLSLHEQDKNGNDSIVFVRGGNFSLTDNKRTPESRGDYRYSDIPDRAGHNRASFRHLSLTISVTPKLVDPVPHRHTIPTAQLVGSSNP